MLFEVDIPRLTFFGVCDGFIMTYDPESCFRNYSCSDPETDKLTTPSDFPFYAMRGLGTRKSGFPPGEFKGYIYIYTHKHLHFPKAP